MEEMEQAALLENIHLNDDNEPNALQIVLLGKTGSGKSSLANTIFGGPAEFKVSHFAGSETKVCQTKIQPVNGKHLRLIDTPGLFDTDLDSTQLSQEQVRFLIECAPGIHTFLILLKVEKFTRQEKEVTELLFKQLTKESLKYTTVVFTHGDQLPDDTTIEEWVVENERVYALVQKCGGRCHVFDNKYWKNSQDPYRNNQVQVENLLQTIEETVEKNGGKYFTNVNLQRIEKEIQKVQDSNPELSRDQAKEIVHQNLWQKMKRVVIGSLIGILVGAVAIPVGIFLLPLEIAAAVAAGVTAGGAVVLGAVGGIIAKASEKKKEKEN